MVARKNGRRPEEDIELHVEDIEGGGVQVVLVFEDWRTELGPRARFTDVAAAHAFRDEIFAARATVRREREALLAERREISER